MRPKRALLITSSFPRWSGDTATPFVSNLAIDLKERGWQIDVLAPHAPRARRKEELDGVTVRRFRYMLPDSLETVAYDGGALINLRQNKLNWIKLPFLVLAELIASLWLLVTQRYAVVNAHWILPQGFVAVIAGRITRTPVVVTAHGSDVFDLQSTTLTRFKRWTLRHSQAITVNSSATSQAVHALAGNSRIATIPMGVDPPAAADPARVTEIRRLLRSGNGPLLLFVGRLVMEKGIDDLLNAVALLVPDLPDVSVGLVGAGQDRARLEELARGLNLNDRVFFMGWFEREEVHAHMSAADVLIGPSKREGLGLVFLEAFSAGTPVIASATGGIPDIVHDGKTGLLVDVGAPDQIADAVRRLHHDPDLGERLAAAGASLVTERYTRQASSAAFSALLDDVSRRGN